MSTRSADSVAEVKPSSQPRIGKDRLVGKIAADFFFSVLTLFFAACFFDTVANFVCIWWKGRDDLVDTINFGRNWVNLWQMCSLILRPGMPKSGAL